MALGLKDGYEVYSRKPKEVFSTMKERYGNSKKKSKKSNLKVSKFEILWGPLKKKSNYQKHIKYFIYLIIFIAVIVLIEHG